MCVDNQAGRNHHQCGSEGSKEYFICSEPGERLKTGIKSPWEIDGTLKHLIQ
jgi:hypothetical protein